MEEAKDYWEEQSATEMEKYSKDLEEWKEIHSEKELTDYKFGWVNFFSVRQAKGSKKAKEENGKGCRNGNRNCGYQRNGKR